MRISDVFLTKACLCGLRSIEGKQEETRRDKERQGEPAPRRPMLDACIIICLTECLTECVRSPAVCDD